MWAVIYLGTQGIETLWVQEQHLSEACSHLLLYSPAHPWKQGLAGVPGALAVARGIQVWQPQSHRGGDSDQGRVGGQNQQKSFSTTSTGSGKCPDWIPWTETAPWEECQKKPEVLMCCKVTPLSAATAGRHLLLTHQPGAPSRSGSHKSRDTNIPAVWLTHLCIC